MISIFRFALPAIFAAGLMTPLAAQANQHFSPTINQRQVNQQRRIFNGVKGNQLSRQEYRNLERRSLAIELQQRRDIKDGGAFTPKERYQLNQRLNRLSQSIFRDRHD